MKSIRRNEAKRIYQVASSLSRRSAPNPFSVFDEFRQFTKMLHPTLIHIGKQFRRIQRGEQFSRNLRYLNCLNMISSKDAYSENILFSLLGELKGELEGAVVFESENAALCA